MDSNFIVDFIKNHQNFKHLNMIEQERIVLPTIVTWVKLFDKCYKSNPTFAIQIAKNHRTINKNFKPILIDLILQQNK